MGPAAVAELGDLHVAQATRGYTPREIAITRQLGARRAFPWPQWPRPLPPNGTCSARPKARLARW